ncbi:MAG TPA: hypothetical protein PK321_04855 [Clostridia bacterium]|nr:hypothetical protein [Clostridia bacterium]
MGFGAGLNPHHDGKGLRLSLTGTSIAPKDPGCGNFFALLAAQSKQA